MRSVRLINFLLAALTLVFTQLTIVLHGASFHIFGLLLLLIRQLFSDFIFPFRCSYKIIMSAQSAENVALASGFVQLVLLFFYASEDLGTTHADGSMPASMLWSGTSDCNIANHK